MNKVKKGVRTRGKSRTSAQTQLTTPYRQREAMEATPSAQVRLLAHEKQV
jgi:hypothetical protein